MKTVTRIFKQDKKENESYRSLTKKEIKNNQRKEIVEVVSDILIDKVKNALTK